MTYEAIPTTAATPADSSAAVGRLARAEMVRYARHPLFLVGVVLTVIASLIPDPAAANLSYLTDVLIPALFIGVFGIIVMYRLTRSSDRLAETSGAPAMGMRARTAALAWAVVVPFGVGVLWFIWGAWRYAQATPPAYGLPFGDVGDSWAYAWLFGLGAVSCAGGPILGLVIARWFPRRGAAVIAAIGMVLASMMLNVLMQPGNFEAIRPFRVFWPFTWFGGAFGVEGDSMRMVIFPGSPQWYVVYLLCLCALGVLVALYRDPEQPRERLRIAIIGTGVAAIALGVITMTTGVQETMINPNPSPEAVGAEG